MGFDAVFVCLFVAPPPSASDHCTPRQCSTRSYGLYRSHSILPSITLDVYASIIRAVDYDSIPRFMICGVIFGALVISLDVESNNWLIDMAHRFLSRFLFIGSPHG